MRQQLALCRKIVSFLKSHFSLWTSPHLVGLVPGVGCLWEHILMMPLKIASHITKRAAIDMTWSEAVVGDGTVKFIFYEI